MGALEPNLLTEIELEKLGFKSVGLTGSVFILIKGKDKFVIEVFEYIFYLEVNGNPYLNELKYVNQLQEIINNTPNDRK